MTTAFDRRVALLRRRRSRVQELAFDDDEEGYGLRVHVRVYQSATAYNNGAKAIIGYSMDYDDEEQREVLRQQARYVFEAGQLLLTFTARPNCD